jgi:hypothetical protein
MVWIGWPDSSAAKPKRTPALRPQLRTAPAAVAATPAPWQVVPPLPALPSPAQPTTNWRLEAQRAAAAVIIHAATDQQHDGVMGSTPKSPYRASRARPAFPWSREPLGKHFDADPHTGIVSLRGKRCTLAFFLIVPGFGCAIGPLDPEPGRGDLFDPKFQPQPLELPDSLATTH